jgi:hypothetical protein
MRILTAFIALFLLTLPAQAEVQSYVVHDGAPQNSYTNDSVANSAPVNDFNEGATNSSTHSYQPRSISNLEVSHNPPQNTYTNDIVQNAAPNTGYNNTSAPQNAPHTNSYGR